MGRPSRGTRYAGEAGAGDRCRGLQASPSLGLAPSREPQRVSPGVLFQGSGKGVLVGVRVAESEQEPPGCSPCISPLLPSSPPPPGVSLFSWGREEAWLWGESLFPAPAPDPQLPQTPLGSGSPSPGRLQGVRAQPGGVGCWNGAVRSVAADGELMSGYPRKADWARESLGAAGCWVVRGTQLSSQACARAFPRPVLLQAPSRVTPQPQAFVAVPTPPERVHAHIHSNSQPSLLGAPGQAGLG